jgi:hypothetical protein
MNNNLDELLKNIKNLSNEELLKVYSTINNYIKELEEKINQENKNE